MGKTLTEMNTDEYILMLIELAEPLGKIANDDAVYEALVECTKQSLDLTMKLGAKAGKLPYMKMIGVLFDEQHKKDTLKIIGAVTGYEPHEMESMSKEMLTRVVLSAIKNEIAPFIRACGNSAGADSSKP